MGRDYQAEITELHARIRRAQTRHRRWVFLRIAAFPVGILLGYAILLFVR